MIDPRLVQQTIDLMKQHPDATVEDSPPGLVDAVLAEQSRQEKNASTQSAIDAEGAIAAPKTLPLQRQGESVVDDALSAVAPETQLGSAIQGFGQGASMMFGDELAGVGSAIAGAVSPDSPADLGYDAAVKNYEQGRDFSRDANKASQETNPVSHGAGMLAGGLTTPLKGVGPTAAVRGSSLGALAGVGSNEDPARLQEDVKAGALLGAGFGKAAGSVAGGLANKIRPQSGGRLDAIVDSWLMTGTLKSEDIIELKALGVYDDFMSIIRGSGAGGFPYGAQAGAESIELGASFGAKPLAGSLKNPGLEVPALQGPQSLDASMNAAYMRPQTMPVPAGEQMGKAGMAASKALRGVANSVSPRGAGFSVMGAVRDRSLPAIGIGVHRVATKMAEILDRADAAQGMSSVAGSTLRALIEAVQSSPNPELEDYLAKEMSAEYNAASIEAANELATEK